MLPHTFTPSYAPDVGGKAVGKLTTILSNEWPNIASYLTETSGVSTRKSIRIAGVYKR